jgi:integrase
VVLNRVMVVDATDGHEMVVETTPKGKRRRAAAYLPLPKLAVDTLKSLRARQAAERLAAGEACRFCPQGGGAHVLADGARSPCRPQWYTDRFLALGKSIGLTRVPLHGSRHFAASLLAYLGGPDVAIAAGLGHTEVAVTQGYTHVFAERLAETSRALVEALTG